MKWPDGRWHKGTYFKEGATESGAFVCFVCLLPVFGRSWSIWWSRTNGMAEAALLGADPNAVFSSRHVLIKKATGPPLHSSFFADLCGKRMSSRLYQSIISISPVFQNRYRRYPDLHGLICSLTPTFQYIVSLASKIVIVRPDGRQYCGEPFAQNCDNLRRCRHYLLSF
jgi:hypothetical protein